MEKENGRNGRAPMSKPYKDDPAYWQDFNKAQAAGAGYTGAVIYAGVRRMLRVKKKVQVTAPLPARRRRAVIRD